MLLAQAADGLGSSSGILGIILSGALLTALIGVYKFAVNFRTTERGMSRQRMRETTRDLRSAAHEAGLWQARCADLDYLLRSNGIKSPPLSPELRKFIDDTPAETHRQWDDQPPATEQTGGRLG